MNTFSSSATALVHQREAHQMSSTTQRYCTLDRYVSKTNRFSNVTSLLTYTTKPKSATMARTRNIPRNRGIRRPRGSPSKLGSVLARVRPGVQSCTRNRCRTQTSRFPPRVDTTTCAAARQYTDRRAIVAKPTTEQLRGEICTNWSAGIPAMPGHA